MSTKQKCGLLVTAALILAGPAFGQVDLGDLEERDGIYYLAGADTPYSGDVVLGDGGEGQIQDGQRAGTWRFFSPMGVLEFEVVYEDGQQALTKAWHADGKPRGSTEYKDGQRNGLQQEWDTNGHLRAERRWSANRPHGQQRIFDHNGNLLRVSSYANGVLEGAATWYYPNGQAMWVTHYAAGERHGTWTQFASDGALAMESRWNAGKLVGRTDPHAGH